MTKINLFVCLCGLTFPQGRLTREKRLREKRKMSSIKIHYDLPQGELPQREERRRKPFLFLCGLTFHQGRLHREKKD
jgi:hypothetical protein